MPVKIRLARRGRKKTPYYHIVVADNRAPRDGRFIEQLGSYNPMTKPATIKLDRERALEWLMKGAQPTDTTRAILRFTGVLYRKHLLRGVAKGAMTQEDADNLYNEFIATKETKIQARIAEAAKEKEDFWRAVSGSTKKSAPDIAAEEGAIEAFKEVFTAPAQEVSKATEAVTKEATATVEEVSEAVPEAVTTAAEEVSEKAEAVTEEVTAAVKEVSEKTEAATEKVTAAIEEVSETAEAATEEDTAAVEKVSETAETATEEVTAAVEEVSETAETATEEVTAAVEEVSEAAEPVTEKVTEAVEEVSADTDAKSDEKVESTDAKE